MAKIFDTANPEHQAAFLAETTIQMALYGNVYLKRGDGGWVTILDGAEVQLTMAAQPGFEMVMDDGTVLPVPAPGPVAAL